MKKNFSSQSVSCVKDPERLLVKQSTVLVLMLSNEGVQLLNAVIQSSTEVKRTVGIITPCSALALVSYSESKVAPNGHRCYLASKFENEQVSQFVPIRFGVLIQHVCNPLAICGL